MTNRTALFVLGMHRSGTSAMARACSLRGAALPHQVLSAGLGNATGHWEPEAAVALHDRLLAAAGSGVNSPDGPAEEWFASAAAASFRAPMRALIQQEFGDAPLFVFKDPRSALVFPLWREVLAELGIACRPIVMLRHPAEVARSLVARQAQAAPWQSWTLERAGLLWLRYMLAAERHSRGMPRVFCQYADLLADGHSTTDRLAAELGFNWPRPRGEAAPDLDAFLDPAQRHQTVSSGAPERGGVWSAWITPCFQVLDAARACQEPDAVALEAIQLRFGNACAATLPVAEAAAARPAMPGAAPVAGVASGRRLGLVITAAMLEAEHRSWLSAILTAEAEVTLIPMGEMPADATQALAWLGRDCGLETLAETPGAASVEPGFLREPVALYRHLRARPLDLLLFPDQGGLGHACVVAKRTGLAFADTVLGVIALGPSRRRREAARRFPADLVALSLEHIEQQAVEQADLLLRPSAGAAQWMHTAGWRHAGGPVPAEAMSAATIGDIVAQTLQGEASAPPVAAALPTVTVVITHYERPRLLEQNLQALLRQTDRDFSVIVVDDGSRTTEARDFLDRLEAAYCPLALRLVRQPNRYLGAARNAGIRAAVTDCVILMDDDNLAFPGMVASLRQAMRHSGADVVTCGIRHFHAADGPPDMLAPGPGPDQVFAGGPLLVGAVHNCFGDASGIYRRAIFDSVGYFHERRGVTYEDWQMHLRVVLAGRRLLSLPEPLVWYRVRGDSMLRTTHRYDNARVIGEAFRHMPAALSEQVTDLLMGLEQEQARLNEVVQAVRAVAAARIANAADQAWDRAAHIRNLEAMLDSRSREVQGAAGYAASLAEALAETRQARDGAAAYARSLEAARAQGEAYAHSLEAELAKVNAALVAALRQPLA